MTRDIPAYTVYGGNPARFLKKRVDDELSSLLLKLRWWDMEPNALLELLPLLCDPDLERVRQLLRAMTDGQDQAQNSAV